MIILVVSVSCIAALLALYLFWRIRFGYPLASNPRVLVYHKITRFEFGGTWVPPSRFVSQLDALLKEGFRFVDEEAFLQTLEGMRKGSDREVLLTFDDGYRELLDAAVPALEERGIPALIFLVSSFVGRENVWELYWPGRRFKHMSWDEILDLQGRGFTFGSHTCTHRDLTRIPLDAVRDELIRSKKELEERLGSHVRCLSYPFGRTDTRITREVARTGYRAAFSMYPLLSNSTIDPFNLRREGVYVIDTIATLRNKLGSGIFFWIEDIKGRTINRVAVLTPILKGDHRTNPQVLARK